MEKSESKANGGSDLTQLVQSVTKAVVLRNLVREKLGLSFHLRVTAGDRVRLEAKEPNAKFVIEFVKTTGIQLKKEITSQKALKYVGHTVDFDVTIHTVRCFYGGNPIATRFPRTRFVCPVPTKANVSE